MCKCLIYMYYFRQIGSDNFRTIGLGRFRFCTLREEETERSELLRKFDRSSKTLHEIALTLEF